MAAGIAVEITVRGRVGASAEAAVGALDIEVVPRHDVVLVQSGDLADLLNVLALLDRRGVEVDRIGHPRLLTTVDAHEDSCR
jgi:hypothetical protein